MRTIKNIDELIKYLKEDLSCFEKRLSTFNEECKETEFFLGRITYICFLLTWLGKEKEIK